MRRRDFLRATGTGALGLSVATCCPEPIPPIVTASSVDTVGVDVHCHVFNAADLPVGSFILGTKAKDLFDGKVLLEDAKDLLVTVVGEMIKSAAPDDEMELAFLRGELPADRDPLVRWDKSAVGWISGILLASDDAEVSALRGQPLAPALEAQRLRLRQGLLSQRGSGAAEDTLEFSPDSLREDVAMIARYVAWCRQLCDFRIRNVDFLLKLFGPQRLGVGLLMPSLVDMARWLPELVPGATVEQPRVSMEKQVALMEAIMRLRPGVHPFVGVDPLVKWDVTEALLDRCFSAGDSDGARGNGFIGVKLYPPMGFAPLENPHLDAVQAGLGDEVEATLANLYGYCQKHEVPVMAHCNLSNDTRLGNVNKTASAEGWRVVMKTYPGLRLNLAHFGGCGNFVNGPTSEQETIGDLMDMYGGVYTDFADEASVIDPAFRSKFVRALGGFTAAPKAGRKGRILYGSDWSMLGIEKVFHAYFTDWYATFREALAPGAGVAPVVEQKDLDGFFGKNALAFLGLTSETKSHRRLVDYYARVHDERDVSWLRLPKEST